MGQWSFGESNEEAQMDWTLWDILWSIFVFFFWVMYIWLFITIFADIFRRGDIHGWAKAGWVILLIFLPLIGALIYMIARPKMTDQDGLLLQEAEQRQRRLTGYSPAEEIAKAQALRDSGAITQEEFEKLKRKAML